MPPQEGCPTQNVPARLHYHLLQPHLQKICPRKVSLSQCEYKYKTISDGGITVDFSIIKVHTSN